MAYPTYITEALVCGSTNSHTADRSFLLLTKEAGMVRAQARSVREERSKQRYALQECSYIRVTLVRGKSGWRIAGTEAIANLYANAGTREARALLRNLVLLVRRVMQGEVVHEGVFTDLVDACSASSHHDPRILEMVATLRILHTLGYIAPHEAYMRFLEEVFPFDALASLTTEEEALCQKAIHTALHESQL
jgi:recombinational DNA repair protein (RecF pathway)